MENITNTETTAMSAAQQSKAMNNAGSDSRSYKLNIHCAIRRRPAMSGLPGTDPNDRVYKIGSSIDVRTKKNLKGVEGVLEEKFMPSIIGINYSDNYFQEKINDYWGNIGVFVPADEPYLKEEEKGKVLKIQMEVRGENNRNKIEGEPDIENKIAIINKGIEKGVINISYDSIPDYVFLCYCLRYSRIAKDATLLDKSPKILFYLYNKNSAVKVKLNIIELRNEAIMLFSELRDNEEKVNFLLVMFGLMPNEYDTLDDKIIALDAEYNKSKEAMERFVTFAKDSQLEIKYLINYAVKKGKLDNPSNTEAYYYNQVLIGRTLDEAVLYLTDDSNIEAKQIKDALKREIKD